MLDLKAIVWILKLSLPLNFLAWLVWGTIGAYLSGQVFTDQPKEPSILSSFVLLATILIVTGLFVLPAAQYVSHKAKTSFILTWVIGLLPTALFLVWVFLSQGS